MFAWTNNLSNTFNHYKIRSIDKEGRETRRWEYEVGWRA